MPRTRTKHELIADPTKRSRTFKKRANSLVKSVNDLSILCGVDIGMVIHNRDADQNNSIFWPSPQAFNESLEKLLDFPETPRNMKLETHEKHLHRAIAIEMENVSKLRNKIEGKMSGQLLCEILTQGKSLNELDLHQLSGLGMYAEEILNKLQNREDELNLKEQVRNVASTSAAAPPN